MGYRATSKREGWKNIREADVDKVWDSLMDQLEALCVAGEVDLILHAGDVFHNHNVSMDSMTRVINGFKRLQGYGVDIVVVSGNHDIGRVRVAGSVFDVLRAALEDEHTHVVHGYDPVYLDLEIAGIACVPWSAMKSEQAIPLGLSWPQIMVAHGVAEGCAEVITTFAPTDLTYGDMRPYDYVALAHLHAEGVIHPNAAYSSSMDRFGWSDRYAEPGWKYVVVSEDGIEIEHRGLETRPFIAVGPFDGSGSYPEVLSKVEEQLDMLRNTGAMLRVYVQKCDPLVKRKFQQDAKKFIEDPWRLSFSFDGKDGLKIPEIDTNVPVPSIMALFDEFLAMKKKQGVYGETTHEMMSTRGRSFLEQAMNARSEREQSEG